MLLAGILFSWKPIFLGKEFGHLHWFSFFLCFFFFIFADGHDVLQAWHAEVPRQALASSRAISLQQYTNKISAVCGLCQGFGVPTQQSNRSSCNV